MEVLNSQGEGREREGGRTFFSVEKGRGGEGGGGRRRKGKKKEREKEIDRGIEGAREQERERERERVTGENKYLLPINRRAFVENDRER